MTAPKPTSAQPTTGQPPIQSQPTSAQPTTGQPPTSGQPVMHKVRGITPPRSGGGRQRAAGTAVDFFRVRRRNESPSSRYMRSTFL